ncbi:SPFH/Band 7/PHB domain protein [Phaeovibrio sulfidiphilus]|uniref:SPFH/Band 7/PHB domain protein n=1 Tax=Phaeovibrio sulfidiphilus TaxID=1220600 RepID=A0A8J7CQI7_9PROT|nr:SPFH domain-containing protein [Phaeovibrio sulfidiphilus]MBE1236870.1 SPFH/Band 7/PHB domain protein [Phaeovibrio sulfidiphilus]
MLSFIGILVVVQVLLLVLSVKFVPQGFEFTVERFGRYTHTLRPGLNLIWPIIDRVGRKINMMENVLDVPEQKVITRDNAMVRVSGVAFYQVLEAEKASYEVTNLEFAILNLLMTNIRTVMGSMDLDELLSRRDEINGRLLAVVDEATNPWGVKLTRVEIMDISPPSDLVDAMARQMKAEREKRAVILDAEGDKQAAILRAEGLKQSEILRAEGLREAAFREAEARERQAQAEAEAVRMVSESLARGDLNALNYFIAEKYVDSIIQLAGAPNQKVLMMPMESSALLGSLGGIAELLNGAGSLRTADAGRATRGALPAGSGASEVSGSRGSGGAGPAAPGSGSPWSSGGPTHRSLPPSGPQS